MVPRSEGKSTSIKRPSNTYNSLLKGAKKDNFGIKIHADNFTF